jgi:hypothetical protein
MSTEPLPRRQEARERLRWRGLDLPTQSRKRTASHRPEHLGVAPLQPGAAGTELTLYDATCRGEPVQRLLGDGEPEAESRGDIDAMERSVGAGVARDEVTERVGDGLEERLSDADRQRCAERVTEP